MNLSSSPHCIYSASWWNVHKYVSKLVLPSNFATLKNGRLDWFSVCALLACDGGAETDAEALVTLADDGTSVVAWLVPRASAMKPGCPPSGVGGNEDRPDPVLELCSHGVSIPWSPCVSGLCTEAQTGDCTFHPDDWMVCAAVDGQGSGRLPGTPCGSGPCKYAPATSPSEFNGQNNHIQCQGRRHLQASLGIQCSTMT